MEKARMCDGVLFESICALANSCRERFAHFRRALSISRCLHLNGSQNTPRGKPRSSYAVVVIKKCRLASLPLGRRWESWWRRRRWWCIVRAIGIFSHIYGDEWYFFFTLRNMDELSVSVGHEIFTHFSFVLSICLLFLFSMLLATIKKTGKLGLPLRFRCSGVKFPVSQEKMPKSN